MDTQDLLKNLTILRDGLIKNGEDNEFTNKLTEWINNINDIETIKDINASLQYKIDPRFDYYDMSPMFSYLNTYWGDGESNKKSLQAFFPRKDKQTELKEVFDDIKNKATHCLELLEQTSQDFDSLQKDLAAALKKLYDRMIEHRDIDRQIAADLYRLSLHTTEKEGLNDIISHFDMNRNQKTLNYILGFCDWLILNNHWCDIHQVIMNVCGYAKQLLEEHNN